MEFLINQYHKEINPEAKLNEINTKKMLLAKEQTQLELETKDLNNQIVVYKELSNEKLKKKPLAIEAIKRKLDEEDFESAERIAKTWSNLLGISALSLLGEAKNG